MNIVIQLVQIVSKGWWDGRRWVKEMRKALILNRNHTTSKVWRIEIQIFQYRSIMPPMHSNTLMLTIKTTLFLSLGSLLFSLLLSPLLSLSNETSITTSLAQSHILTTFLLGVINLALSNSRCSSWKWERRKNIRLNIRKIRFLQSAIAQQIGVITSIAIFFSPFFPRVLRGNTINFALYSFNLWTFISKLSSFVLRLL